MSNLAIGFIATAVMLGLIAIRVPIALALGGVSLIGLATIRGVPATLGLFGEMPMQFAASWSLSAMPMFILMGAIAFHTGLTASIFEAARLWLSRLPGGLAIATNFASAGFAAASGSSLATCAAMGRIAIPEMLKNRYDPALATGCVAAAGTIGALIPPSLLFVLFGWMSGASIGALLLAGILPGLLTAFVYSVLIIVRVKINPQLAPPIVEVVSWRERFSVLRQIWPLPLLIGGVIVSIYSGFATATEAAALGAFLAFLIGIALRRLNWTVLKLTLNETLISTANIFFVAIGALLFTRFLAFAGVPTFLATQIGELGLDPITIILGLSVIYLVLGCFLDPLGVLLLTLPVILPVLKEANIDLIWAGVIIVKYLEIGMITPPMGLNVYVVKGVAGKSIPVTTVFRGAIWFLLAEVVIMALIIAFPQISLFIPNQMR